MNHKYIIGLLASAASLAMNAQVLTPAAETDFNTRKAELAGTPYFKFFDNSLPQDNADALKILYAYMPLPDITDYPADFFKESVEYTLKAREEMPWGKSIPDREFRYFVLPMRVNNEHLDRYRPIIYEELKDRVKGLSMKDAILEINHWCHEKVTYQPSDARTHSPLNSIYSAIGRCGEESTFTVSALRAMGIPARQVYTPRWAHTDDNHAWVEAWADGKWYFFGACEPEPVLNLAWFNAPASRGLLMHTRVMGKYDGPEEKFLETPLYTDINVTENYAPTAILEVEVLDADGKPAPGAEVSYRLYNYAEFYPLVTKKTDDKGCSSLKAGLGDLLVWATDGKSFGFEKASVGKDGKITVRMDKDAKYTGTTDITLTPPQPRPSTVEVSAEQVAENDRRKAYEDSIRGAYTASFPGGERAATMAANLNIDRERGAKVFTDSRGNSAIIAEFLESIPAGERARGLGLLENISVKDVSDVPLDILRDHYTATPDTAQFYYRYVMSPRIDTEHLTPFRSFFNKEISKKERGKYKANPEKWVKWVAENIDDSQRWEPSSVAMSPISVWQHRKTNPHSRDIFFVASARAMEIPARIDQITGKTQWADKSGVWHDAVFTRNSDNVKSNAQSSLALNFTKTGRIDDPKYYANFSLARIVDGKPQSLGFDDFMPWSETLKEPMNIDPGQYMLVSGQRMASGAVLSRVDFFEVAPGAEVREDLVIRQDNSDVQVIGSFNSENLYHDQATDTDKSLLSTTGRGYYILGILAPNQEPTNHALRDIAQLKPEFEKWGHKMMLLFRNADELSRFDAAALPALPETAVIGTDLDNKIADEVIEALKLSGSDRPIFIIADTFNRVVFVSQGYTIGLGNTLIDVIHKLKE